MEFYSSRLGKFNYTEDKIIFFPFGIPGFDDFKKYVLLSKESFPFFYFLHSIENKDLMFVVTDPFIFVKEYSFEISDEDLKILKLSDRAIINKDFVVFSIVTIHPEIKSFSLNLKAPVVINLNENIGEQLILYDYDYPIRYHINYSSQKSIIHPNKKIDFKIKIS